MTDLVTLTETKTRDRFDRVSERALRTEGYGATPVSLKITQDCLPTLISFIQDKLQNTQATLSSLKSGKGLRPQQLRSLLVSLRKLPAEAVALCALNATLHAIGKGDDFRRLAISLGTHLNGELWAEGLLRKDERLQARIERAVRKKHGGVKQRTQAARSMAARAGYMVDKWSKEMTVQAGGVVGSWVFAALPEIFYTYEGPYSRVYPAVREDAVDDAIAAVSRVVAARPVNLPCVDPPLPWTGMSVGGYPDERVKGRITLLRRHSKIQGAAARAAIKDGTMQPVLDAINSLQNVAWKINRDILDVMFRCIDAGVHVKGLPRVTPYPKPAHPKPWEKMSDDERKAWRRRADKIEQQNRGMVADRLLLTEDVSTAELLASEERFYTPTNADWRGRVYPMPHFNFQRDDRVRALFLFADGAPLGADGLRWLKIHVANCGDFDKISKRPFQERVEWVNDNLEKITNAARSPLTTTFWMLADKPFLFLAGCLELEAALRVGPSFITTLPVSFDGSCSGLQHLAAMTRDENTAAMVNLTPAKFGVPQDVYQTVASVVQERIAADAASGNAIAVKCLAHGIDRKLVKRNVMTLAYGSKKFGMAQQHNDDLMRPLETKFLAGEIAEHPFAIDDDNGRAAAKYIANHTYNAITELVKLPTEAMGFLQALARALAHEGKPVCWTTPAGLPWVNAYYEPNFVRVRLWLHDASIRLVVADGDTKEVDKNKSSNGVAPNFVHANDAAHLMLTVNAAVLDGIRNIATVHDSFGCLAPAAVRFNEIIREQFVEMYDKHDVLAEVFQQATCDLTNHNTHRLPDVVDKGTLNINEVINAQFAFA